MAIVNSQKGLMPNGLSTAELLQRAKAAIGLELEAEGEILGLKPRSKEKIHV